jgi:ABC-type antimicrobial peptide transport system permease subunit
MLRIAAVVQLLFIILIVGFSTYQLFQGRFEVALGLLPFLMVYYIFVTVRHQRKVTKPGVIEKRPDSKRT